MYYDTYNMELDSIIESFKLDMFNIEHENFMNIMYSRHNGILNESIIHEANSEKLEKIKNTVKEFFKNIWEKSKNSLKRFMK